MPFQLSPGVNVTEIDLTTVIPAVATTEAAIGGVFRWGPVEKAQLVTSEAELAVKYAKPSNLNSETWFTASSFLAYADALYVSRAHNSTANELVNGDATLDPASPTEVVLVGLTDSNFTGKVGDIIFGDGIPEGTTITAVVGGGSQTLTISKEVTVTSQVTGQTVNIIDRKLSLNAVANSGVCSLKSHIVKNDDVFESASDSFETDVHFIAKFPGELGNSLKVSVCDSASAFESDIDLGARTAGGPLAAVSADLVNEQVAFTVGSNTATISAGNTATTTSTDTAELVDAVVAGLQVGDLIEVGNNSVGKQFLEISGFGETDEDFDSLGSSRRTIQFTERYQLSEDIDETVIERRWQHYNVVSGAPGQSNYVASQGNTAANDELHVVVTDEDGSVTGIPGSVIEVWDSLSRATDAKNDDAGSLYWRDVINQGSAWIWVASDFTTAPSATALLVASSTEDTPRPYSFVGGKDIPGEADADSLSPVLKSYDLYKSAEDIDVSLVLAGKSRGGSATVNGRITTGFQMANYLIDNIAESRKDCVVFCSPDKDDVVDNGIGDEEQDVVDFRGALRSTSYAVLDSGYKYMYDKYNDVYRWIPLNGDTAGLAARTDDVRDPWYSPAGFNRGQIKNVIKLAWNPKKAERDLLYKNGVNPIVNFPGQGIIMFGDKTLLAKPSAFDRINVRRLFIVLEKAIATAAKFTLFEFNDEFTRSSFVNLVEPYLRDVQGRRGITDFVVVCDETNNTGEVIDRNEFVGDIYIKPARSINFIQLNFVAVRTGVEFSEVIGNF